MRKLILVAAAAATLACGGAFAQSKQGGYLGQNPGSGQQSARVVEEPMTESPMSWCRFSPEPSRCRARSAIEHTMCQGKSEHDYTACRFALDQMHGQ